MAAHAIFPAPVDEPQPGGFLLSLDVITMQGHEFVVFQPDEPVDEVPAEWWFPWDFFRVDENPADAARRVVSEWTGTSNPKLEIVDFVHEAPTDERPGRLNMVFRALLVEDPQPGEGLKEMKKIPRGSLTGPVGLLDGRWVEQALQSSLPYKLTRA